MRERLTLIATTLAALLVSFLSSVSAGADPLQPEIVATWNSLPYKVNDTVIAERWKNSQIFGKALIQGLKIDSRGNMYVTTARWGGPEIPATVSKLVKNGDTYELVPFPDEKLNDVANPRGLKAVLGFEIDRNDVMWILDQGHVAGQPSSTGAEKLVLWDIKASKEIQRYEFPAGVSDKTCSFLNDIVVDNDSGFAYITDSGINCDPLYGGLIVYDMKANWARRVLDRSMFTNDEPGFFFNIGGRPVGKNAPMRTGADGVALSGDKATLYWTNLTGNRLYAIETALLREPEVSETDLQYAVRVAALLPSNTDGMTADRQGNVYMTALQLDSIMKRDAQTGRVSRLAYHPEMVWPDTLAWGPDGSLYVVSNHLHVWVDGDMNFQNPPVPNFRIWRLPIKAEPYTRN